LQRHLHIEFRALLSEGFIGDRPGAAAWSMYICSGIVTACGGMGSEIESLQGIGWKIKNTLRFMYQTPRQCQSFGQCKKVQCLKSINDF
jgi:hypothetical protein